MKSIIIKTIKIAAIGALVLGGFVFVFQGVSLSNTDTHGSVVGVAEAACNSCPTPIPDLLGTCFASPTTVGLNEDVRWTANASGGTGSYTYSWRDDEGHIGNGKTVTTSYFLTGDKSVIVSITSGAYTIQRQCHVNVVNNVPTPTPVPNLIVDCAANPSTVEIGDTVNYNATASGGTGSYTYSWSGSEGLSSNSQSVSKIYTSSGTKTAFVTVTAGAVSRTATCSAHVNQAPTLSLSCYASPSTGNVNDTITYIANASGGNGNYNYTWSGTDGLSGSGGSVSKQYSFTGTKTANVTVTSNGQSRSATCTSYINQNQNNNITANCYASPSNANVGEGVNWTVNASGGNGNFNYSWSGTDGLYGYSQTIYKSYQTSGTKSGTVTVSSNGQSITAYCSMNVNGNQNGNLSAYCYGNPSNPSINSNVTWSGTASGGNGNYNYTWSGTDGLYGYNQTISKSYSFSGSKSAVLTVTSNGQTAQATCYVNVGNNGNVVLTSNPNGNLSSGVFLSQVPYTGGELNLKVALFVLSLVMFSAFGAYMIIAKKNAGVLATSGGKYSQKEMIARFKEQNKVNKGL